MSPSPVKLIRKAQSESLFGFSGEMEQAHSPYMSSFGATDTPYDLGAPGAITEIKRALKALGNMGASMVAPDFDRILETAWQKIQENDVWDEASALEFLFFVSRYKNETILGTPWAVEPFYIPGEYPSPPQPSVMGLELLASAVNDRLKGVPEMTLYQAWRGGMLKPPAIVSAPSKDTPVKQTSKYEPSTTAPMDATEAQKGLIRAADDGRVAAWFKAVQASNENDRKIVQVEADGAFKARAKAIADAGKSSPANVSLAEQCAKDGGKWDAAKLTCVMPHPAPPAPGPGPEKPEDKPSGEGGSALPWVLAAGVLGVAAYLLFVPNGPRSTQRKR
jgi:hypothetical protein